MLVGVERRHVSHQLVERQRILEQRVRLLDQIVVDDRLWHRVQLQTYIVRPTAFLLRPSPAFTVVARSNTLRVPPGQQADVLGGLLGASEDGSFNVKTSWIYEAVRAGRLPCHRVGRHIRFTRPMLDDWLAEQPRR